MACEFKINQAEANNLWFLLNNRHTFYMLSLAERAYIPEIKSFCGTCLETEQILNPVYNKKECKREIDSKTTSSK